MWLFLLASVAIVGWVNPLGGAKLDPDDPGCQNSWFPIENCRQHWKSLAYVLQLLSLVFIPMAYSVGVLDAFILPTREVTESESAEESNARRWFERSVVKPAKKPDPDPPPPTPELIKPQPATDNPLMAFSVRFEVLGKDSASRARRGRLSTPHGVVETPVFQAVGTAGTVKALAPDDLHAVGTQILLGNTYHLMLRPGGERIQKMGGLHKFMCWDKPILTDSGGFQVFSLAELRNISEGSRHLPQPYRRRQVRDEPGQKHGGSDTAWK